MSAPTNEGISQELADGIRAYKARIEALGGYGVRVSGRTPDGVVHTGALYEAGASVCQPAIRDANGKGWRISLDSVRRVDDDVAMSDAELRDEHERDERHLARGR